MILLLFLILTGCAVKCDEGNNYYVIQMVDDPPEVIKKPFRIYWNVPTMQCKSKKIPFENLYEKYGIIQNKDDSFRGEKIAILYDPGSFPALLKNDTSGKYEFRNGGVPQEGNLEVHLAAFRNILKQSIPDSDFSGIGIIDFESWRPVFRQNFGALIPYKDVSYQIERNRHWMWPTSWIQSEAKKRFEEHARVFMETTIATAKAMRPQALWGYYGFPYCFNMASNNMVERCADRVPTENDYTYWLWRESTALYPSLYSSKSLSSKQLSQLLRGRVNEAARVRTRGTPILPYFWYRYRDGGFLSEADLQTALKTIYQSDASGLIIWGSSNDVNDVEKCLDLLDYINNTLGPLVSKYTRLQRHYAEIVSDETESYDAISENNSPATTIDPIDKLSEKVIASISKIAKNVTTIKPPLKNIDPDLADPDFEWNPPENYTQDIIKYVQDEFNKKSYSKNNEDDLGYAFKDIKKSNESKTILKSSDESKLIELIVKTLIDTSTKDPDDIENTTDSFTEPETKLKDKIPVNIASAVYYGTTENIQTTTESYIFSNNYEDFDYKTDSTNTSLRSDLELTKDTYNIKEKILTVEDYLEDYLSTTEDVERNFGEFKDIDYDFTTSKPNQTQYTTDGEDILFGITEIIREYRYEDEKSLNISKVEIIEDYSDVTLDPVLKTKDLHSTTSTNDYVDVFKKDTTNIELNSKYSEKLMDKYDSTVKVTETEINPTKSSIEQVVVKFI